MCIRDRHRQGLHSRMASQPIIFTTRAKSQEIAWPRPSRTDHQRRTQLEARKPQRLPSSRSSSLHKCVNRSCHRMHNSSSAMLHRSEPVSYTHLRAHETVLDLVCRLLLEKKKKKKTNKTNKHLQ